MEREIQRAMRNEFEKRHSFSSRRYIASTRVSPGGYMAALFVLSFAAAFLIYCEMDTAGISLFGVSLIVIPLLAFRDRIGFDGKRLHRTGLAVGISSMIFGARTRLKLSDIEQVETQALRALKRGRNVKYRFSTTVRGKGCVFTFVSGGESYRRLIKSFLHLLPEDVLDARSIELRDYLIDSKTVRRMAEDARIPSADVLEGSLTRFAKEKSRQTAAGDSDTHVSDPLQLRDLANHLRLTGFLLQSLETFRRALIVEPRNGWLLLECSRCLLSLAGSEKDPRIERRSVALMKLAEKRAGSDKELLARVGETYFQAGQWRRAAIAFRRVSESLGESFRSVRGMAEIALREGKIAHVIHQFSAADRLADSTALRRWARNEADYFSRLNADEEYLELEVSRMNLIERLERYQRASLRIVLFGFPLVVIGIFSEDFTIADLGWTVSAIAIALWFGLSLTGRLMAGRIPFEMVHSDDDGY